MGFMDLKKENFTAEIYEDGFLLYFFGHLIGGEGIPCSTPVSQRKAASRQLAEERIKEIIDSRADKSYMLVVGAKLTERMRNAQCCLY